MKNIKQCIKFMIDRISSNEDYNITDLAKKELEQIRSEQQEHRKEVEELHELIANAHDQIIGLSTKFGLEQYAHNDLREKLKEIIECYECSGDGIGTIDWKWAMDILKQAIKEDSR